MSNSSSSGARSLFSTTALVLAAAQLAAASAFLLIAIASPLCRGAGAEAQPPADLVVAPTGDDANPGTVERPLATLEGARDAVRALKQRRPGRDLRIVLRGGEYRLRRTVIFGLEDSGTSDAAITYAAWPGERPVISSDVAIGGWRKLEEAPAHLPEAARGRVWVADLAEYAALRAGVTDALPPVAQSTVAAPAATAGAPGASAALAQPSRARPWRFLTLYDGESGRRLPRARGKGFAPINDPEGWTGGDQTRVEFAAGSGAIQAWPDLGETELLVIPKGVWAFSILPLASVDEAAGVAHTTVPCTYQIGKAWGHPESLWVENALAVLDEPGEWVIDSQAGKLYLWPEREGAPGKIVAPLLTEFIRVEGGIDYDGPRDEPVRNLRFEGLTFTHGERYQFHGMTGWGVQHDWERFDASTAMVRLRGAEGCALIGCRFEASGGSALRMDLHCQKNTVSNCAFRDIGAVGILLAGYGPGTKNVNRANEIVNNTIERVGQVYWQSPVLFLWQSGENRVEHNLIRETAYSGIVISTRAPYGEFGLDAESARTVRRSELGNAGNGDWHAREPFLHGRRNRVARNEITDVMRITGDGNCVYVSGTGGGNLILENYMHDCPSPHMGEMIRCDDDQHQTRIEGNIMWRFGGMGTAIAIKGVNDIVNNVIALPLAPRTERALISLEVNPVAGSLIEGNIMLANSPDQKPYAGALFYATSGVAPKLSDCRADRNVYHNTADADWGSRHLAAERPAGIEAASIAANPGFVDAEDGDFRLRDDAPARKLGIRSLDRRAWGPRQ